MMFFVYFVLTDSMAMISLTTILGSSSRMLNRPFMNTIASGFIMPDTLIKVLGNTSASTVPLRSSSVMIASQGDRATLQAQVLTQAQAQLGLRLQAVQTIVEKRATFACTPGLLRPAQQIAPGLLACGDYVAGPYPATLEGAVRSGVAAAAHCS